MVNSTNQILFKHFGCVWLWKTVFIFLENVFQKMKLSFHFQFSMKILEKTFGWNSGVFIFHFRKLENVFRKFWKTTKISFLIYIEVGKHKIFIFLKNFWKLNQRDAFSKFSFSLENFLGTLENFHNQTHSNYLRKQKKQIVCKINVIYINGKIRTRATLART